jgi:Replication factor A protein 3
LLFRGIGGFPCFREIKKFWRQIFFLRSDIAKKKKKISFFVFGKHRLVVQAMDFNVSTARVNGNTIKDRVGERVRLVGKVVEKNEDNTLVYVECSAGTRVTVSPNGTPLAQADYNIVEILGILGQDDILAVESLVPYGDNFDLTLHNQFITVAANYPTLFLKHK